MEEFWKIGPAAFETIARRMPILWWNLVRPSVSSQAEMVKMVIEKQLALADSMFAVQMEFAKAAWRPWWLAPPAPTLLDRAMAPVVRRAKANARRLRQRQAAP